MRLRIFGPAFVRFCDFPWILGPPEGSYVDLYLLCLVLNQIGMFRDKSFVSKDTIVQIVYTHIHTFLLLSDTNGVTTYVPFSCMCPDGVKGPQARRQGQGRPQTMTMTGRSRPYNSERAQSQMA